VIEVILYVENYNMGKWLKTVSLKRPHERNMTVWKVPTVRCQKPAL
jgi:hypothetical protein